MCCHNQMEVNLSKTNLIVIESVESLKISSKTKQLNFSFASFLIMKLIIQIENQFSLYLSLNF